MFRIMIILHVAAKQNFEIKIKIRPVSFCFTAKDEVKLSLTI